MDRTEFLRLLKDADKIAFTPDDINSIIKEDIKRHGSNIIQVIAIEELSELSKEVSKCIRNRRNKVNLLEEMADVVIGIITLGHIHGIDGEMIFDAIKVKALRLKRGFDKHDNNFM